MIKSTPLAFAASLVAAVSIGVAPHAAAQPTPCDMLGNPMTTAIAMLEAPPYGIEQPTVVSAPCSDVGSDCHVSAGAPIQRVGQGQQPQCLSNYTAGAGAAGAPPFGPQGPYGPQGPVGPYGPRY